MSPTELAGIVGAAASGAVSTGFVFVKHILPLLRRAEADRAVLKREVGVGDGNSTLSELVTATSRSVQRIEEDGARNWSGITEVLRIQKTHGEKLDAHEKRFGVIEGDHKLLHKRLDSFACAGGAAPCAPSASAAPRKASRR